MTPLKRHHSHHQLRQLIVLVSCWAISFVQVPQLHAESIPLLEAPTICDINFNLLKSNPDGERLGIVTADTVSAEGMTLPSFWWMSEQLPAKLVTNWIANRKHQQVYVLVNSRYWNTLDYIEKYRTIDQFGRVAQGYGYNLKLCSSQKIIMASYSCNSTDNSPANLPRTSCQLWLSPSGQNGLGLQGK